MDGFQDQFYITDRGLSNHYETQVSERQQTQRKCENFSPFSYSLYKDLEIHLARPYKSEKRVQNAAQVTHMVPPSGSTQGPCQQTSDSSTLGSRLQQMQPTRPTTDVEGCHPVMQHPTYAREQLRILPSSGISPAHQPRHATDLGNGEFPHRHGHHVTQQAARPRANLAVTIVAPPPPPPPPPLHHPQPVSPISPRFLSSSPCAYPPFLSQSPSPSPSGSLWYSPSPLPSLITPDAGGNASETRVVERGGVKRKRATEEDKEEEEEEEQHDGNGEVALGEGGSEGETTVVRRRRKVLLVDPLGQIPASLPTDTLVVLNDAEGGARAYGMFVPPFDTAYRSPYYAVPLPHVHNQDVPLYLEKEERAFSDMLC